MVQLLDFEKSNSVLNEKKKTDVSNESINHKYEKGETRIVTEQGAFKLPLLGSIFSEKNYCLQPSYQRRITWDNEKRSKLIESFIMNIPVPPVFLYEEDFNQYEVMDGLQRITALIDFYAGKYELCNLQEWPELNGRKYENLPEKIKEGIDRRQLSYVILLKESAQSKENARRMKKMVFERLNTGGVSLSDQEIRNALIGGPFNEFCIMLSYNEDFCRLWNVSPIKQNTANGVIPSIEDNDLYTRMDDVELVLRFFAMRNLDSYKSTLSTFLDEILNKYNAYSQQQFAQLEAVFLETMQKALVLFGDKAFCLYKNDKRKQAWSWTKPQKFIYDAMVVALMSFVGEGSAISIDKNLQKLAEMYEQNAALFDGKKTNRNDITEREKAITKLLKRL